MVRVQPCPAPEPYVRDALWEDKVIDGRATESRSPTAGVIGMSGRSISYSDHSSPHVSAFRAVCRESLIHALPDRIARWPDSASGSVMQTPRTRNLVAGKQTSEPWSATTDSMISRRTAERRPVEIICQSNGCRERWPTEDETRPPNYSDACSEIL